MRPMHLAGCLLLGLLMGPGAQAQDDQALSAVDFAREEKIARGYPNERWRLYGMREYAAERPESAATFFRKAARFGDKHSQHRLSLMYWFGDGVPRDRAEAYAWSDLAAERGNHPQLIVRRDLMWTHLEAADRARVQDIGAQLYAEYGDDVAMPRLEQAIRRHVSTLVGSRLGFTGSRVDSVAAPANGDFIAGSIGSVRVVGDLSTDYSAIYDEARIDVRRYMRSQGMPIPGEPQGRVEVRSLREVQAATLLQEGGVVQSRAWLAGHPDVNWRQRGEASLERGDYNDALKYLVRAARYSDKPAQALLGEMYWDGRGVPQDRVLGYIWTELAAERQYRPFVAQRLHYWERMTEAERVQAAERREVIADEYGDAQAKARLVRVLERHRRYVGGSRTGFSAYGRVVSWDPEGGRVAYNSDEFFEPKYWEPERYFQWLDSLWQAPPRGRVDVGPLREGTPDEP